MESRVAVTAAARNMKTSSVVELEDLGADFLGELLWVSSELDPW